MKWLRIVAAVVALALLGLSLLNASWLAPKPPGKLLLVAKRGITQPRKADAPGGCEAEHIVPGEHLFIENTVFALQHATRIGADAFAVDVAPTRDGRIAIFADDNLDCRTNGSGPVTARSFAELQRLDAGYAYTGDGGKTFPLRGRGIGAIPSAEDVLKDVKGAEPIFVFHGRHPKEADMLAAAFGRAGVPLDTQFGVVGHAPSVARMLQLAPGAWGFDAAANRACHAGYATAGWIGQVPDACRGATIAVPLGAGWRLWGWPNRFLARMRDADARVLVVAREGEGVPIGLTAPRQLAQVPRDYRGHLWVDDMWSVGRALQR